MNVQITSFDDRSALFRTWLCEHAGLFYKVVRAFAPSQADHDDLMQEILLQLWISIPKYEGDAKPSTWIYRLALNTALAWKRKEKKHQNDVSFVRMEDPPVGHAQDTTGEYAEKIDLLYAGIRSLPKIDAALIVMHLDDHSYRDIAEVLGISENHVGVKIHRIKKRLIKSMKESSHEPG